LAYLFNYYFSQTVRGKRLNTRRLIKPLNLTLACLGLIIIANTVKADKYQSLESIRFQAEEYIMQFNYKTPYLPEFKVNYLDSRLKLASCNAPLQIEFSNHQKTYGSTSLNIDCHNSPKWRIRLPIKVDVFDDVIVAQRPFSRSQKIDSDMLIYEKRNISLLNEGFFTQVNDLKHTESKRNLRRGSVLTQNNTRPSEMVKLGQSVTLILDYKGISVRTSGRALQSARIGQLVKVRNSKSQKIVEGVVFGEGLVKINL
jgi:flagella basal body P-ring formation protein FlgA